MAEGMVSTMYAAPGIGLAAPQVGVQKRLFVYDLGEGPRVVVNPEIRESNGESYLQEGCLSIPREVFDLLRPKEIHLVGCDLYGNEISIEAEGLLARVLQHEVDHLDGILIADR